MKTKYNLLTKFTRRSALVAAIALTTLLPSALLGADGEKPMKPMKGGEHLTMLNAVNTKQELDALKTGDTVAMVCTKCKTVWLTRIKQGTKGAQILNEKGQPTELIGTHACTGCKDTWTVTGHTKGDITELKHSCGTCGSESTFCCATKGGAETEKEKK
jgi:hypothetical protein